jgi:hypothetical protein
LLLTIILGAPKALAVNKVLSLDGSEGYVEISDNPSLDITDEITLEAWIKGTPDPLAAIIDKGDCFLGGYSFRISGNEPACAGPPEPGRLDLFLVGDNYYCYIHGTTRIDDDRWYHVAGTYDGQTMKVYVDGVLETSFEISGNIRANDINLGIGRSIQCGGRYFKGFIDEVYVWNIARTQEDIRADMNQPIENPESLEHLVGYWNFDSGTADDL